MASSSQNESKVHGGPLPRRKNLRREYQRINILINRVPHRQLAQEVGVTLADLNDKRLKIAA